MTIQEAIRARHTVRKYTDKPIPAEIAQQLEERIERNNAQYGLSMRLVCNEEGGMNGLGKLMGGKGVCNYIALAAPDRPDAPELLGYCGADVMLYAQTLGLNSWWIGGMFDRRVVSSHVPAGSKVNSILVVGYGENQGTPHKRKPLKEVCAYEGDAPQWFLDGVEAVLYAPTAMNRRACRILGKNDQVLLTYAAGPFSKVDLGICKYHFEAGAGKENFRWNE